MRGGSLKVGLHVSSEGWPIGWPCRIVIIIALWTLSFLEKTRLWVGSRVSTK